MFKILKVVRQIRKYHENIESEKKKTSILKEKERMRALMVSPLSKTRISACYIGYFAPRLFLMKVAFFIRYY
jgi:hypothetical protein